MAEVIPHWPEGRKKQPARFIYPWDQWSHLDENGHGDIWLASRGIDFPVESTVNRFRQLLYDRASVISRRRERDAPLVVKRVTVRSRRTGEIREKVKRVPDFKAMHVKVKIVSDEQIAFQFYDSQEAPPEPEPIIMALPKRRQPLHQAVNRRTIERVSRTPVGV